MNIFYIDQQSYHNLSIYDYNLLDRLHIPIHFFGSKQYDYKILPPNIKFSKIFNYSKLQNKYLKIISYFYSMVILLFHGLIERPRIYHFQWIRIFYIDLALPYLFKKIYGTSIVFTVHNLLPRNRNERTIRNFKKLYHFCDVLIVHTETSKNELIQEFKINPNKIKIMPHGLLDIIVDSHSYNKCKKQFSQKFNLESKQVITVLGSQSYYKGTDLIINAWTQSEILSHNDNVILIIAGKNETVRIDNDSLSNNIKIINRVLSNEEFKALMNLSDVMALPYREIDQSGLLLSILNERIPYCCTDVGELTAPLKLGDIGWVIRSPNPLEIAILLESIISEPSDIIRKKNDNDSWDKIQLHYSWNRSAKILRKIYEYLLNSSN